MASLSLWNVRFYGSYAYADLSVAFDMMNHQIILDINLIPTNSFFELLMVLCLDHSCSIGILHLLVQFCPNQMISNTTYPYSVGVHVTHMKKVYIVKNDLAHIVIQYSGYSYISSIFSTRINVYNALLRNCLFYKTLLVCIFRVQR